MAVFIEQLATGGIMGAAKPFSISKRLVMEAYRSVKSKAGTGGIDKQSITEFERNLKAVRMSSAFQK